jgi:hypothetical protein
LRICSLHTCTFCKQQTNFRPIVVEQRAQAAAQSHGSAH